MERQELLRIRKAMKVTQAQMADLLRLSLATIKKLEAGTLDPPTSKKIVRGLIARDFWLAKATDKLQRAGEETSACTTPGGSTSAKSSQTAKG